LYCRSIHLPWRGRRFPAAWQLSNEQVLYDVQATSLQFRPVEAQALILRLLSVIGIVNDDVESLNVLN